jgi:ESS family glutamate:Na+ symporter
MLSAGLTFLLAIPFIMSINLPAKAFTTGSMFYYWIMMAVAAGYMLYVTISYVAIAKKKSFDKPGQFWYRG